MKIVEKTTTLTDGSTVFDINIFCNSRRRIGEEAKVIISCCTERDATEFLAGLKKLLERHTVETFGD